MANMYKAAYAESINPILDFKVASSILDEIYILPPITKTHPGKPRKKKKASQVDLSKIIKCGQCAKGHNRTYNEAIE